MIDFHTHTFLSDGALCPAEHIRRAEVAGYEVLGISDHGDFATMEYQIAVARKAADTENSLGKMKVIVGIELTHVRPVHIADATRMAHEYGADIVLCHGETIAEPVMAGTNRAAIQAGVDYLAHPGLITLADAKLAAKKGVLLEISAKAGHSLSNGHVAKVAAQAGAKLAYGSDAHGPEGMYNFEKAQKICFAAGLTKTQVKQMFANAKKLADRF